MTTTLIARDLTKIYRTGEVEVHALRGANLDLYEGELVVILGPSGSGKSTLLNIIGGLDTATSGTVRFRDHQLTGADESALTRYRRDHVGFVFQFYNLIPSLTAEENVALVTEIAQRPLDPGAALGIVGLGERRHHFPAQLSAANSSALPSRVRSPSSRSCCSAMSPPGHSTARPASWCSRPSTR
jgi:putative ABC transport system ATP-binding protein